MAQLIYSAITSLDGYVEDETGNFDWAAPDEEVHAFVNDQERPIGTYLYGRKLYETMRVWETWGTPDQSAVTQEYARIWQAADKIVYSSTLDAVTTPKTRLERTFDPDAVRALKESAAHNLTVGGATLAAHALRNRLVDEVHLFLNPVIVGGGNPAIPDGIRTNLELIDDRRFGNGVVHLHYLVTGN